ncbi:PqqD family protein [Candidatus Omnitrophota bacterium]
MELHKNKLHKNPQALTRIIDSNAVVIFLSDESDSSLKRDVYIFNATGSRIWDLINGKNNIAEITRKLYPEYNLTLQKLKQQINKFVSKLNENRLIDNATGE